MNVWGELWDRARVALAVGASVAAGLLWRHGAPPLLVEALAILAGLAWFYSDE